jgi:hypothetical protein
MKPTLDSINRASAHATTIELNAGAAVIFLAVAGALYQTDSTDASLKALRRAREQLVNLRRTQTAALEQIDEAIKSTQ